MNVIRSCSCLIYQIFFRVVAWDFLARWTCVQNQFVEVRHKNGWRMQSESLCHGFIAQASTVNVRLIVHIICTSHELLEQLAPCALITCPICEYFVVRPPWMWWTALSFRLSIGWSISSGSCFDLADEIHTVPCRKCPPRRSATACSIHFFAPPMKHTFA